MNAVTTSYPRLDGSTSIRTVAFASLVGTTVEWYDFFLYGTAAALVFNRLYFPTFDPRVGTLAAFGTYSIGFIARPLGGIVIGHFGDRVGRKAMLVFTLMVMGIATFGVGLLPTYATWGWWAAVALVCLRFLQGFAVGGEWGGAVLMSIEHAPDGARGFYGSWPQMGVPAGLILATLVFALVSRLPEQEFLAWGWRIPFLSSAILVVIGLAVRFRIRETPVFDRVQQTRSEERVPLISVLREHRRELLLTIGMKIAENGSFYIYTVFVLVYATQVVGFSRPQALNAVLIGSVAQLAALPVAGLFADRFGRRPVYLFGAVMTGVCAFPFFTLLNAHSMPLLVGAMCFVLVFPQSAMYGPQAAFFSELFGARVRYSGASIGAQVSSVLGGGLSPLIATALSPYGSGAIAVYLIVMAVITFASVLLARETRQRPIFE